MKPKIVGIGIVAIGLFQIILFVGLFFAVVPNMESLYNQIGGIGGIYTKSIFTGDTISLAVAVMGLINIGLGLRLSNRDPENAKQPLKKAGIFAVFSFALTLIFLVLVVEALLAPIYDLTSEL